MRTIATPDRRQLMLAALTTSAAALVAGCGSTPLPPPPPPAAPPPPAPPPIPPVTTSLISNATDPRSYRKDAAAHIYRNNSERIYQGMMPPLLYAVGVLQVELDGQGRVMAINWMRAPNQAPEVIAEIERTIRQLSPFPAPVRMGRVTYTDTWLWDQSGKFQLDTLTEGQH